MPSPADSRVGGASSVLVGAASDLRQAPLVDPAAVTVRANRDRPLSRDLSDTAAKALIAGLFLGLAYRVGLDVLDSGRPTGLLLLASESLVVVMTLVRRAATDIDRSWRVRLIAAVSMTGPFLLKPTAGIGALEVYTVSVSAIGLAIVVAGKLALGRSFGLLPANRGVVCSGLYRLVRHPIYLGYVLTHGAFLAANPSWWNMLALGIADAALMVRASYEETTLLHDATYARYRQDVRWRLVPGIF